MPVEHGREAFGQFMPLGTIEVEVMIGLPEDDAVRKPIGGGGVRAAGDGH